MGDKSFNNEEMDWRDQGIRTPPSILTRKSFAEVVTIPLGAATAITTALIPAGAMAIGVTYNCGGDINITLVDIGRNGGNLNEFISNGVSAGAEDSWTNGGDGTITTYIRNAAAVALRVTVDANVSADTPVFVSCFYEELTPSP